MSSIFYRSDEGLTPLHIAAAWGRLEIVYLLLVSGANPELKDINKMSALDYACEHGYYKIADLIKLFSVDQSEVLSTDKASCNLELGKLCLSVLHYISSENASIFFIFCKWMSN